MNCCICGTLKNCEPFLNNIFENIEKIGSLFSDFKIIMYYDVSSDNTLELLKNYQNKDSRLLIHINTEVLSEYRTFRIAKGRNICLNYVIENHEKFPYFIMMDMDDVNSNKKINIEPIKKMLNRDDWDTVSFNKLKYYDIWALSIKPFYLSCHHFPDNELVINRMTVYIENLLKNANKDDLIQCASAFNGFAIYRTNKFLNCHYYGGVNLSLIPKPLIIKNISILGQKYNNDLIEDCEHRNFHLMAINKNNAKIRISPEIVFL
jgi:hypothetical protein